MTELEWFADEVNATRLLFNGHSRGMNASRPQVTKLLILFKEYGGEDRDIRIEMLKAWTGIERLDTSSRLSMQTASVMIDYLTEEGGLTFDGIRFFFSLEDEAKARIEHRQAASRRQVDKQHVSDLQKEHLPWIE
jgi:hypothetical protein